MSRAARIRTDLATGSVAIPALDGSSDIEVMTIVTGEVLRSIINTGNVWNPWMLANGGATSADVKLGFRIASQATGSTAHFQQRHWQGSNFENAHNLTQSISTVKAYANYAFFGAVSGGNKYWQVGELDIITGTYTELNAYAPTAVSTAIASVTGVRAYINPPVSTSAGWGSAQADLTHAGSDYCGMWIKEGAECAGGNFASVADMFVKPDPAAVTALWSFSDAAGQMVVADETGNGFDITIGGTELTDAVWIGNNLAADLDDNAIPAGAYNGQFGGGAATDAAFRNGRAEGHASDRNTAHLEDVEFGYGGAGGAGPVNVKTDSFRWLSSMQSTPAGWTDSGNMTTGEGGNTNAIRDDLLATGEQTGTLLWTLAPQFVADTSGPRIFCQRKFSGGTLNGFGSVSVTATAGPALHEVWGAGSGFVEVRSVLPGSNDWTVLYRSSDEGETANWTSMPSALGWRWQSKNRTNATSTFSGANVTWCDAVGSVLIGQWAPATSTSSTSASDSESVTEEMPARLAVSSSGADDGSIADEMPGRLAVAANGHDEIWDHEEMPARLSLLGSAQDEGGFTDSMPARLSIPVTMQDSMGSDDAAPAPTSASTSMSDSSQIHDAMPARLVLRATFADALVSDDASPAPAAAGSAEASDDAGFTDEIHATLVLRTTFQDSIGSDDASPLALNPAALTVPVGWYLAGAGVSPNGILRYGEQIVGTIAGVVGGSVTVERFLAGIPAGRSLATARLNIRLRLAGPTVVQKVVTTTSGAAGQIIDDGSSLAKQAQIQFLLGSADTVLVGTRRMFYDIEVVDDQSDTTTPEVGLTELTT